MTKLYMQNALYAREHGEVDQFRAHLTTMGNFAVVFPHEVNHAIMGYTFHADKVVEYLSKEFSFETVECVIAYMVQLREFDGRIKNAVHRWANRVNLPATIGDVRYVIDDVHSVYLNALAEEVMKKSRY